MLCHQTIGYFRGKIIFQHYKEFESFQIIIPQSAKGVALKNQKA